MIDRVQRVFYQICDVTPADFWQYTQAETEQMIDVKIKDREIENKNDLIKRTSLEVSVMNAPCGPHLKRGQRYPYKLRNFLPKDVFPKKEVTEAEKSKNWLAAGTEMMAVVEQHKKETMNVKKVRG